MANARDIKRKIQSVQNTQKITKAMKMVSAAKMRKALEAMTAARPYSERISEVVKDISHRTGGKSANVYMEQREVVNHVGILLISSDKGLCGTFNANVIKEVAHLCGKYGADKVRIYLIGKRAFDFFKRRPFPIAEKWVSFGGKYTYQAAIEIGKRLVTDYDAGEIDELHIVYNQFKSTASQYAVEKKILPVSFEGGEAEVYPDFQYEPDLETLLSDLLPQFITTVIYQGMLESAAGEHGARMVAMENATRSAGEMIKKLVLNYNKARQGAITRELLDIVNGAEALK